MENNDKNLINVKKYINKNNKIDDIYVFLLRLSDYIDTLNNIDIGNCIIYLINNNIIKEKLDLLVNMGKIDITNINNIYKTKFILLLLEVYCSSNSVNLINNVKDEFKDNDIYNLYISDIKKYKLLTKEEETELFKKIKNNDKKAKELVINSNLRLTISIAKMYTGKGLDMNDLIQEGNIGLMKAVDKFDASKNFKFSTYATWWIKQSIIYALLNKVRIIKIPISMQRKMRMLNKNIAILEEEKGRNLSDMEIINYLNISLNELYQLKNFNSGIISLNRKINQNGDTALEYFINDNKEESPENMVLSKITKDEVMNCLNVLQDREKEIILLRYGFYGRIYTLEEIGQKYGLTEERIRQIEKKCIKKLKFEKSIALLNEHNHEINYKFLCKFENINSLKKFDKNEELKFEDGTLMSDWFYSEVFPYIDEYPMLSKIKKQYDSYIEANYYNNISLSLKK